ncbi:MAG TPA: radical SAM protein [Aggregatilineales bacterium]|nr:radical SAM protein [Anaerolineales bacterium]HRE46126.1 radical SAM protein [Aggregatilineales bacterium]
MLIQSAADPLTKITQMGDVTLYEPAGDQPSTEGVKAAPNKQAAWTPAPLGKSSSDAPFQARSLADCISNVSTPSGAKPMLKTMLTTACERNCYYCPFRAGRSRTTRVTISPDELAAAFDTLQRAKQVDGLFLSSGIIKGSVTTQDKLIDAATILRKRYGYRGYIHLKIMPGAEYDQIHQAMQLADRISVNLEAPTDARLSALAPKKEFHRELLQMLLWAEDIRRKHPGQRLARSVTQFVVGAVGDTDLELLGLSDHLYAQASLTRVYYSAFSPVGQTPLETTAPTDPLRTHRLYQASFLLRDYGWNVEELPFQGDGNMRLEVDPKRAWAEEHLPHAPVEIMTADRAALLRVPGIGVSGAEAILTAREKGAIRDLSALRKLGIRAPEQAAPFILLGGRRVETQGRLF